MILFAYAKSKLRLEKTFPSLLPSAFCVAGGDLDVFGARGIDGARRADIVVSPGEKGRACRGIFHPRSSLLSRGGTVDEDTCGSNALDACMGGVDGDAG